MNVSFPEANSTNALITFPKTTNDLFIFPASFNLYPSELVFPCLSEPAKSTK